MTERHKYGTFAKLERRAVWKPVAEQPKFGWWPPGGTSPEPQVCEFVQLPSVVETHSVKDDWVVTVSWRPIGRRIEPTALVITPPVGKAVTADAVRRLPIGEFLAVGRNEIAQLQGVREKLDDAGLSWSEDLLGPDVEVGKPQRGKRLEADELQHVADVYRAAWQAGHPVNNAVRKAFTLSRDGAAKRIGKARAAGLLEGIGPKR